MQIMLNLRELSSDKPDLKECKVKLSAAIQSLNAFLRAERNPERMGEYFLAVSNALHDFAKLIAKYEPGENYFSFSILLEQMGLPTQFVPQILAAAYSH